MSRISFKSIQISQFSPFLRQAFPHTKPSISYLRIWIFCKSIHFSCTTLKTGSYFFSIQIWIISFYNSPFHHKCTGTGNKGRCHGCSGHDRFSPSRRRPKNPGSRRCKIWFFHTYFFISPPGKSRIGIQPYIVCTCCYNLTGCGRNCKC